ncbi:MAG: MFS transporter [Candidatus Lokiarchaeota archaeon]|nr:MFS transporter [Candidatus Lokiarchaeota archaeon]
MEKKPTTTKEPETSSSKDPTNLSWFESVKHVTSNRNWTIYLLTVWIYSSMSVLQQYFTLYFRDIGVTYFMVGVFISLMFAVNVVGSFAAGYLADNFDRRKLSVITMVVNGISFFGLAFVDGANLLLITFAMIIAGLSSFTGAAGQAYSMQQVDRKFGGVANSLFTLGTTFGLVPLFVITLMLGVGVGFVEIMRYMLLAAAVLYWISALIRATVLESLPVQTKGQKRDVGISDFFRENVRGLKLLMRVFPIFVGIIALDAFSDSFYNFASLYYVNETLDFGIPEINLMQLITLVFSVPLTLVLGRVFDKQGGRKLTIAVYSIMPFAVFLLVIAQTVPYIAPIEWLQAADQIYPGFRVIFSLAFLATAIKRTNDILWFSVLGTYILKSLPRPDLGKMLSLTQVIVLAFISFGPIPAGYIYTLWEGLPLLYVVIILNIFILGILITKSIEPRVSVEELEREYGPDSEPLASLDSEEKSVTDSGDQKET